MKVLIVDDEKLALSRLNRLLIEEGILDITACSCAIEAIKVLSKEKFDVVFLDISMPDMNGLELANTIVNLKSKNFYYISNCI